MKKFTALMAASLLLLSFGTIGAFLQGQKAQVCHNGVDIEVAMNAVPAHMNHGDHLGACDGKYGGSGMY